MSTGALKVSYLPYDDQEIAFDTEKVNILLVDDLPDKVMSYEAILEDLGQNIFVANSGEEALKLVLKYEFAVILLDVNMPNMDGFETAALIRGRKKSARTPIIFLTAFTDEIRMAQGYASGGVDYLPTPVVPEILKAKIKVFIELSQMRRQAALQAEEKAMRKAAEDSAKRFEFLMNASEIMSRTQDYKEMLGIITSTSVPFLSDATMIWIPDNKTSPALVEWAWINGEGNVSNDPLASFPQDLPWLQKLFEQVITSDQAEIINDLPRSDPQISKNYISAMVVPLGGRAQARGTLTFFRKDKNYSRDDIALAIDFTSRVSVALENTILVEKIRETDHRKDVFLATLAHELRNPLAPIRNALEIMKINQDPKMYKLALNTIERQLKQMVHLVDDLMDVSRITQGKIELRKGPMILNDALHHAIETALPLVEQRGQVLNISIPDDKIWMEADFTRISQIFSNLLNNAAKYTDNGGVINLTTEVQGNKATIIIEDNGIGIPPSMLSNIFEMFSQVDSTLERTQGGLGIGLTLVKSLVDLHSGSIRAESKGLTFGSKFIVTLPITQGMSADAESDVVAPSQNNISHRILVVDDNEASAQTMGWMLEIFGHEISIAHDGPSAIKMAETFCPSIVLLDIGLPGVNGYEVCRAMNQIAVLKDTVFIAQTGWGQQEHRDRSKDAGFHYHLVKPVDMQELQDLISNLTLSTDSNSK